MSRQRAPAPARPWPAPAPLLPILALVVGCGLFVQRDTRPLTDVERSFVNTEGELLLARNNCTACHAADDATLARVQPLPAPDLSGIGERVTPEWLAAWLDHGHDLRPGTRMPDVLHDLDDADDRAEVIDELVHFLLDLGDGYRAAPTRDDTWDPTRGEQLFDSLGCRACHPDGVDGDLPAKTDRARLATFLQNPLAHRPAGLMPDFALSSDEADALASWLLQPQFTRGPSAVDWAQGLELSAYEIPDFPSALPDWSTLKPVAVHSVTTIDVEHAPREEQFGLVYRGELHIDRAGEQAFFVESDDGSRLWIDDQLVIDHDGLHSPSRKDGRVTLQAGWHAVTIEMFEAGGGQALDAGFVGADDERLPFAPQQMRHHLTRYDPIGHHPGLEVSGWKAWWGGIRFEQRRCGACHSVPDVDRRSGADLDELEDLFAGCLAEQVPGRLPDFHLDYAERHALRETLAIRGALRAPLPPERVVDHALRRLDCLACHVRHGEGGPTWAVRAGFTSGADLGDEGRLPPDLTDVGARLQPQWLARVLRDGERVRPYLHARMPRFGDAAVAALLDALPAADVAPSAPPPPQPDAAQVAAGRDLAGTGGLNCITCHSVAGHEGVGQPGLDLATTAGRMTWPAFHEWLLDPIGRRPGTRMPSFFDEGRSVKASVLDGDAEAQIAALWSWLSLGYDLPLPPGLVVDRAGYEQVPVERPIVASVFMEGLSPRVVAVGYPERVSAAFDVEHVRLAELWRGAFLNLEGTWRGRAGQLENPAGEHVLELPPGPALALLDEPWPAQCGRESGWRMAGQTRDDHGRPTFRYGHVGLDVQVQEHLTPGLDPSAARVLRRLQVAGTGAHRVWLRAALASGITSDGAGRFHCDGGLTVVVRHGRAELRDTDAGTELLVNVGVLDGPYGLLEVELIW